MHSNWVSFIGVLEKIQKVKDGSFCGHMMGFYFAQNVPLYLILLKNTFKIKLLKNKYYENDKEYTAAIQLRKLS